MVGRWPDAADWFGGRMSMDFMATDAGAGHSQADGSERREAQRFASLIRAAKLVGANGEFVCVIRDVSTSGISVRTFHKLPAGALTLTLQNGDAYDLQLVRANGNEASFTFADTVDVEKLIVETSKYPKRQLRVNLAHPAHVSTATQRFSAIVTNLSQQGAQVQCDAMFAIEQPVRFEARPLPDIRAKIRWRSEDVYGLAFDTTFTLREFAQQTARLQAPALLES